MGWQQTRDFKPGAVGRRFAAMGSQCASTKAGAPSPCRSGGYTAVPPTMAAARGSGCVLDDVLFRDPMVLFGRFSLATCFFHVRWFVSAGGLRHRLACRHRGRAFRCTPCGGGLGQGDGGNAGQQCSEQQVLGFQHGGIYAFTKDDSHRSLDCQRHDPQQPGRAHLTRAREVG